MRDAVALLADGRTALALAGRAALRAGDTVLIEAAAGGVGTLLVQIARNAGARVVALAGQPRKLAIARDLGADLTVDYSRDGWDTAGPRRRRRGGRGVRRRGRGHRAGGVRAARRGRPVLPVRHGQREFRPGHGRTRPARQVTVRPGATASPEELAELTRTALAEAAAGRLRPVIGQEFELAAAASAHAAIEARTTIGKTLLTVPR